MQRKDPGLEEGGKSRHSGHGAQGKGAGQEGLQIKGHGRAGLQGAGSKGHGKAGRTGKGQGKAGGRWYMGSPVFPGRGMGWWGAVVPPAITPVIPLFPPPPYVPWGWCTHPDQRTRACHRKHTYSSARRLMGRRRGGQGGNEEEHRRAWERIGEEERRLREREARIMGGADRVAEDWTEGQDRPWGGEAQAVEELQRAWADLWRRLERVERAEREGGRHGESGGPEGCPPLLVFRQPAIPPEQEGEMQERAWRQIRDEPTRLVERDREVAVRERRVWKKEEAVARGAPEGNTP